MRGNAGAGAAGDCEGHSAGCVDAGPLELHCMGRQPRRPSSVDPLPDDDSDLSDYPPMLLYSDEE